LKVSTNVKIAMTWFENFGVENAPNAPPWLRAWLGTFCKISFTPTVTFRFQVHAPKTDIHIFTAALLCYSRCHWYRNLCEVNCTLHWIVLTLSTLQMGITLTIVVAYHCYGYTTITKCPQATTKAN